MSSRPFTLAFTSSLYFSKFYLICSFVITFFGSAAVFINYSALSFSRFSFCLFWRSISYSCLVATVSLFKLNNPFNFLPILFKSPPVVLSARISWTFFFLSISFWIYMSYSSICLRRSTQSNWPSFVSSFSSWLHWFRVSMKYW